MFKKFIIGLVVIGILLAIVISRQPADFHVSRSAVMNAPASAPFAQVNDLRNWGAWDPWAKVDPNSKMSVEGSGIGVGSTLNWSGNRDVGEGSMTITESQPNRLVHIRLDFKRPMVATNQVEFTFTPEGKQTRVAWTMTGQKNFVSKAMGLVMDCDKMIGGSFEKGLASMKTIVENTKKK